MSCYFNRSIKQRCLLAIGSRRYFFLFFKLKCKWVTCRHIYVFFLNVPKWRHILVFRYRKRNMIKRVDLSKKDILTSIWLLVILELLCAKLCKLDSLEQEKNQVTLGWLKRSSGACEDSVLCPQHKTLGSCLVVFVQQHWSLKDFWVLLKDREIGKDKRKCVMPLFLKGTSQV